MASFFSSWRGKKDKAAAPKDDDMAEEDDQQATDLFADGDRIWYIRNPERPLVGTVLGFDGTNYDIKLDVGNEMQVPSDLLNRCEDPTQMAPPPERPPVKEHSDGFDSDGLDDHISSSEETYFKDTKSTTVASDNETETEDESPVYLKGDWILCHESDGVPVTGQVTKDILEGQAVEFTDPDGNIRCCKHQDAHRTTAPSGLRGTNDLSAPRTGGGDSATEQHKSEADPASDSVAMALLSLANNKKETAVSANQNGGTDGGKAAADKRTSDENGGTDGSTTAAENGGAPAENGGTPAENQATPSTTESSSRAQPERSKETSGSELRRSSRVKEAANKVYRYKGKDLSLADLEARFCKPTNSNIRQPQYGTQALWKTWDTCL